MAKQQREYAAGMTAKERRGDYGTFLSVGVNVEKFVEWLTAQKPNAKGYVNLTISARKEIGKYGETHSVYLDTYQPKPKGTVTEDSTLERWDGDDESVPFAWLLPVVMPLIGAGVFLA